MAHRRVDHVGGEPVEQAPEERRREPPRVAPEDEHHRGRRGEEGEPHEKAEGGDRTEDRGEGRGEHTKEWHRRVVDEVDPVGVVDRRGREGIDPVAQRVEDPGEEPHLLDPVGAGAADDLSSVERPDRPVGETSDGEVNPEAGEHPDERPPRPPAGPLRSVLHRRRSGVGQRHVACRGVILGRSHGSGGPHDETHRRTLVVVRPFIRSRSGASGGLGTGSPCGPRDSMISEPAVSRPDERRCRPRDRPASAPGFPPPDG